MAPFVLCALFAAVVWAAVVDAFSRRIPNAVVLPAVAGAVAASLLWNPVALIGGVAWWLLFSAMHARARRGSSTVRPGARSTGRFGGGDAKLAAVCGVLAAWNAVAGVLLALCAAGLVATAGLAAQHAAGRRRERPGEATAPMAPGMAVGTMLAFAVAL